MRVYLYNTGAGGRVIVPYRVVRVPRRLRSEVTRRRRKSALHSESTSPFHPQSPSPRKTSLTNLNTKGTATHIKYGRHSDRRKQTRAGAFIVHRQRSKSLGALGETTTVSIPEKVFPFELGGKSPMAASSSQSPARLSRGFLDQETIISGEAVFQDSETRFL